MRWIPASILLASFALATVPYTFPAGVPARASQVNRNFEALDSLLNEQIAQVVELRQTLVAQTDSLRRNLAELRQKMQTDSSATLERFRSEIAADTGWMALALPKGSVLGSVVPPGPDGYLPGSDRSWQEVDSFGIVEGLPAIASPATVAAATPVVPGAAKPDSAALAKASSDTARSAVVAQVPPKSVLHWFVKIK